MLEIAKQAEEDTATKRGWKRTRTTAIHVKISGSEDEVLKIMRSDSEYGYVVCEAAEKCRGQTVKFRAYVCHSNYSTCGIDVCLLVCSRSTKTARLVLTDVVNGLSC